MGGRLNSQDFENKLLWVLGYFPLPDQLLVILVGTRPYKQELGIWADVPLLQSGQQVENYLCLTPVMYVLYVLFKDNMYLRAFD